MSQQKGSISLFQGGHEIDTVFDLFGFKEDDISQAIAWSLKSSSHFLALLLNHIGWSGSYGDVIINLQRPEIVGNQIGRTDIEVQSAGSFHIILEAKRGWNLPGKAQLEKYARRESFRRYPSLLKCLVTVSECSREYAEAHSPLKEINGIPIRHISWRTIVKLARQAYDDTNRVFEKRLLKQLVAYFRKIMRVQRIDSNLVYVVSVSPKTPDGWDTSWIDIIEKYNRYFHPIRKNWPKEPPAYIGFRYRAQLQSIHFIKEYEVIDNLKLACLGIPDEPREDLHYLYHLGPAIRTAETVKAGKVYRAGRVWAAIDTLLTSDTISEARDLTAARLKGI